MDPTSSNGWSVDQANIIQEHMNYYQFCLSTLTEMKTKGPDPKKKLPKLAAKPKRSLSEIYQSKTKKRKQTMTPHELHEYLKSKIVDVEKKVRKEIFFFTLSDITSWEIAEKKLVEGYTHIRRHEATSMFFNIQYGMLLESAFQQFKSEQVNGTRAKSPTWKETLQQNIGICISYSEKLREIARLLWPYAQQFARVGISFTEIYSLKRDVERMFAFSEEIKNFWSQKTERPVVTESEQTSSQPESGTV